MKHTFPNQALHLERKPGRGGFAKMKNYIALSSGEFTGCVVSLYRLASFCTAAGFISNAVTLEFSVWPLDKMSFLMYI
jgi:hypothetical protein